jgi:ADP-ribose pyrophosphatase
MVGRPNANISLIFMIAGFYRFARVNCYNKNMKLIETFQKRKALVKGKAVHFRIDQVRLPNRKSATREYLDHPGAVAVVPLLPGNKIVLVRQFRYPVNEVTWELPAGKLAKGENPLSCVRRELQEETGYKGKHFKRLMSFWPTAAFANEVIHIYVAKDLKPGPNNPDDDEFIHAVVWPLSKALRAIRTGKIKDSKTIIGVLALTNLPGARDGRRTRGRN